MSNGATRSGVGRARSCAARLAFISCIFLLTATSTAFPRTVHRPPGTGPGDAWTRAVHGPGSQVLTASALRFRGSGYFIGGTTNGPIGGRAFGGTDGVVARYGPSGHRHWLRVLGGDGQDVITDLVAMPDGGVAGVGFTRSASIHGQHGHGDYDVMVFRLSRAGELVWLRISGTSLPEQARSITRMHSGALILAGEQLHLESSGPRPCFDSKLLVAGVSPGGVFRWDRTLSRPGRSWFGRSSVRAGRKAILVGGGTRPACVSGLEQRESGGKTWTVTAGGRVSAQKAVHKVPSVDVLELYESGTLLGGTESGAGTPHSLVATIDPAGVVKWLPSGVSDGWLSGLVAVQGGVAMALSQPPGDGFPWRALVEVRCWAGGPFRSFQPNASDTSYYMSATADGDGGALLTGAAFGIFEGLPMGSGGAGVVQRVPRGKLRPC